MKEALIAAVASIAVALITTLGTIHSSGTKIAENSTTISELEKRAESLREANTLPIGTIVASLLNERDFAAAVGDPSDFDLAKSKWTLADHKGRIPGTKWASITSNKPIPDLRGVFLRGVNLGRDGDFADPDGDREAGSLQADAMQEHVHNTYLNGRKDWPTSGKEGTRVPASAEGELNKMTSGVLEARAAKETRPKNAAVYYYVRIN